eukprot:s1135_g14.t2
MERHAFEVSWLRLTLLDFEESLENSVRSTVMRIITGCKVKILSNSAERDRAGGKHPISYPIKYAGCWRYIGIRYTTRPVRKTFAGSLGHLRHSIVVMDQPWSQDATATWGARNFEGRGVGILVEWQNKGFHSFGWLSPIHLPQERNIRSSLHGGDIYVHCNDIKEPRLGGIFTFVLYNDRQDFGAQDCEPRSVIRFAIPATSMGSLRLPTGEARPAKSYLRQSLFYPQMEEKGITLRRYLWEDSLQILELWGLSEAIVAAADDLNLLQTEVEVLLSPQMARRITTG